MRIRTKLLVFFACLSLWMGAATVFVYAGKEATEREYDRIVRRLLLLNGVSGDVHRMLATLTEFMNRPSERAEAEFQSVYAELLQKRAGLSAVEPAFPPLAVRNYGRMIDDFLRQSDLFLTYYREDRIEAYTASYQELSKIAEFIKETTFDLTDSALTQYTHLYERLQKRNDDFRRFLLSFAVATACTAAFVMAVFAERLTGPIRLLEREAKRIGRGDFSGDDVRVSSRDEIRTLAHAFNVMKRGLREHVRAIREQAEIRRQLQEAELRSLQSQINPHFLFNTLNTISKMAYLEGAEETNDLIQTVSAMLRYSLRKPDGAATVADEIEQARRYFRIQEKRFGDRVRTSVEVEASCLSVPLPNLTIQPLIENAFIHGVEKVEGPCFVSVRVYADGGWCHIEVRDNGVDALPAEADGSARTTGAGRNGSFAVPERRGHSTGLGLPNVWRRLSLFYQGRASWCIEAPAEGGTVVVLCVPMGAHGSPAA